MNANFQESSGPEMEHVRDVSPLSERPFSLLKMSDAELGEHSKQITEAWRSTAASGPTHSPYWGDARNHDIGYYLEKGKILRGARGTSEEAEYQMLGLIKKAKEMGFAPEKGTAGEFLDRVAKELGEPMNEQMLTARSQNIQTALGKYMPVRTTIGSTLTAEQIVLGKNIPNTLTSQESRDLVMMQRVVSRVYENTGVAPQAGQSLDEYLHVAIRGLLKKVPTLHALSLLTHSATGESAALSSPSIVPQSTISKPSLRWDREA
jgi:hypothetical protein